MNLSTRLRILFRRAYQNLLTDGSFMREGKDEEIDIKYPNLPAKIMLPRTEIPLLK